MNAQARRLIAELQLAPLPGEGGFVRQTWRTATASAILFLVTRDDFSALHRLAQDELWQFHSGDCLEHVQLDPHSGALSRARLGPRLLAGHAAQTAVPRGVWQGARLAPSGARRHGWALVGCTVSPPWDERGFELGARAALQAAFPTHAKLIAALTR